MLNRSRKSISPIHIKPDVTASAAFKGPATGRIIARTRTPPPAKTEDRKSLGMSASSFDTGIKPPTRVNQKTTSSSSISRPRMQSPILSGRQVTP